MSADFNLTLSVDAQGVILYTVSGVFEYSRWLKQHAAAVQEHFGGKWDETRPVVVDIRKMQAPKSEWIPMIKDVFSQLDVFGEARARCAFIHGDSTGRKFMSEFYIKCRRAMRDDGREQRAFQHWEDGYAWATANQPQLDGAVTPFHPA